MKEYKFEKVKVKGMPGFYQKIADYQQIIHARAKERWELVQVFTPPISLYGAAGFIEIIFARDKK